MNVWIEVAVIAWLFAIGSILFGHFDERTPGWRRILYHALRGWKV